MKLQALVLAAGKGTRMRSSRPKVLHELLGVPVLDYVLRTLADTGVLKPTVVVGSGAQQVRSFINKRATAVLQRRQRGTGHAVLTAKPALRSSGADVLVWPGDMPLLQPETLREFIRWHRRSQAEASVLSSIRMDPKGYGRILRAGERFYAIREELDATEAQRRTQEVNTGIYLFKPRGLFEALGKLKSTNAKGEYYLTDTIETLAKAGRKVEAFPFAMMQESLGINSQLDLTKAIAVVNKREIERHQEKGVTVVAPDQTFIASGVKIGRDTTIHPWCYIESGVSIGKGCEIGPYAKIRKGSRIDDGAIIGSFVEVVRSHIGKKVMAKHLAYLGDSMVGDRTNIGAGTITANFDGKRKRKTRIGKKVLIGSNTVLVAPVNVGDNVKTGAGAVIKHSVKKGAVVVGVPARPLKRKKSKGKS